jgi:hypothetical protein
MRIGIKLTLTAIFVLALATAAAAQSMGWVSVSADGTVNGGGSEMAVSDNGRFVAFTSTDPLVPGDTENTDVFVKDMNTGFVELVSKSSNGTFANSSSTGPIDISADGRFVTFESGATNLVPGDTNARSEIFIHDRQTGNTTRPLGTDGSAPLGGARDGAISANGRYVAFTGGGYEPGFAANDRGVYVFDRQSGMSERVTDGVAFVTTSATYANVDISDDGRYVAFTTGEFGSQDDVIIFDRNIDTYEIANPRNDGMRPQSSHPEDVSLSGNGRFVTFSSPDTNYVAGDPDGNDVFVYDANADSLERIAAGGTGVSNDPMPVISANGRFVAFTSREDVYDDAPNGQPDVVVYDRQTDTGEVVSRFDDGSPADSGSGSYNYEQAISRDGRFVAFYSDVEFDASDSGDGDVYIVDREGVPGPGGDACADKFDDVDDSNTFVDDICWLADEGITRGCNPPANTEFCPKDPVTRGQMGAFLVRALGYTDNGGGDLFIDDNGNTFEGDIDRLGTAGVTRGCNPPANTQYCPNEDVTREQMAAFLRRALSG